MCTLWKFMYTCDFFSYLIKMKWCYLYNHHQVDCYQNVRSQPVICCAYILILHSVENLSNVSIEQICQMCIHKTKEMENWKSVETCWGGCSICLNKCTFGNQFFLIRNCCKGKVVIQVLEREPSYIAEDILRGMIQGAWSEHLPKWSDTPQAAIVKNYYSYGCQKMLLQHEIITKWTKNGHHKMWPNTLFICLLLTSWQFESLLTLVLLRYFL